MASSSQLTLNPRSPNETLSDENYKSLGHLLLSKLKGEHANRVIFIESSTGEEWLGLQLYEKILNVACALVDLYNFARGTAVGIGMANSVNKIILSLGVICAGGLAVSLSDELKDAELMQLSQRVDPKFLFCRERDLQKWAPKLESLLGHPLIAVSVDDDNSTNPMSKLLNYNSTKSKSIDCIPRGCVDPLRDIAFITTYMIDDHSGPVDTSVLRVVPVTHRACLNEHSFFFDSESAIGTRVGIQVSLEQVGGRWLVLRAIIEGYTGVVIQGFKLPDFINTIAKHKIEAVVLGQTNLNEFIHHSNSNDCDISSLRIISPASCRVVYWSVFNEFLQKNQQIREIYLGYGSAEISILTMRRLKAEDYMRYEETCGLIPSHTKIKILNGSGQPCTGQKEEGLLHICGPTVLPGYYDVRSQEQSSDFPFIRKLPHPDAPTFDSDGFYITRDYAYLSSKQELFMEGSWRWFSWDS